MRAPVAGYHTQSIPGPHLGDPLSPREELVLVYLRRGLQTKEIAAALDRSPRTIENQLRSLYLKRGVDSRARLLAQECTCGEPSVAPTGPTHRSTP